MGRAGEFFAAYVHAMPSNATTQTGKEPIYGAVRPMDTSSQFKSKPPPRQKQQAHTKIQNTPTIGSLTPPQANPSTTTVSWHSTNT